jgi:hypothetical protein
LVVVGEVDGDDEGERPSRLSMSDDTDDVDPENPRPGSYGYGDAEWYYVDEDLARTISLGPVDARDGEGSDDWVLGLSAAVREAHPDDAEKVYIRLDPKALHELYVETEGLSTDQRQAGHSAECQLCGDQVDLDEAWPDGNGEPTHPDCWADAYQKPLWWR